MNGDGTFEKWSQLVFSKWSGLGLQRDGRLLREAVLAIDHQYFRANVDFTVMGALAHTAEEDWQNQ